MSTAGFDQQLADFIGPVTEAQPSDKPLDLFQGDSKPVQVDVDGRLHLVPTSVGGRRVAPDVALREAEKQGFDTFPSFDTPEQAEEYAQSNYSSGASRERAAVRDYDAEFRPLHERYKAEDFEKGKWYFLPYRGRLRVGMWTGNQFVDVKPYEPPSKEFLEYQPPQMADAERSWMDRQIAQFTGGIPGLGIERREAERVKKVHSKAKSKNLSLADVRKSELDRNAAQKLVNAMDVVQEYRQSEPAKWVALRTPVVGAVGSAIINYDVASAAKRIGRHAPEPGDYERLAAYLIEQEESAGQPWWKQGLNIASYLPAFMVEFASTGGAFRAGTFGTKFGLQQGLKQIPRQAAAGAAGALAQTAAMPYRVAESVSRRRIPEIDKEAIQFGELKFDQESLAESLPKGFLDAYIEVASERSGAALTRATGLKALQTALFRRWVSRGGKTAGFTKFLERAGYHGMIEELMEERAGEAARFATGVEEGAGATGQLLTGQFGEAFGQLAAESLSFAFPGVAKTAGAAAEGAARKQRLEQLRQIRAARPQDLKRRAAEVGITGTRKEVKQKLDEKIKQGQEVEDAKAVPGPEKEVREVEGSEGVRGRRQDKVGAEQTGKGPPAPEVQVEQAPEETPTTEALVPKDVKVGVKKATSDEVIQWMNESKVDDFNKWVRSTAKGRLAGKNFTEDSLRGLWDQSKEVASTAPQPAPEAAPAEEAPTPAVEPEASQEAARGPERPPKPGTFADAKWDGTLGAWVSPSHPNMVFDPGANGWRLKTPTEAEPEPAKFGKEPADGVGIAATAPITPPRGGVGRSVTNFFQRFFTTRGELPDDVYRSKVRKEGRAAKEMQKVRFAATDFRRGINKALGGRELTQADLEQMNAVLRGEADMATVPEEVRAPLQAMRDHIDSLSRSLIAEGVAQGDLVGIVDKNLGVYTTRSYRVFDDPKWRDKVPVEIRNRAWEQIGRMYPDKSEAERQGILESLLFRGAAETPAALLRGSKLGSKDLTSFMKRKDVPEWLRDLWGEYKDAGVNYVRSVFKMSHLLANQQFLNEAREAGLSAGWLRAAEDGPTVNEHGEVITQIAAEGSSVMEPLNGMYTTPEIKAAFERLDSPGAMPSWLRALMAVNYAVKYAKTVGSFMTHVRNFISNAGFAVANGHWRVGEAQTAWRAVVGAAEKRVGERSREYYQRLVDLGLVGEDVRAGELKDALRDASKVDIDEFLYNRELRHAKKAVELGRAGARFINALYQTEDSIWKIYAFENEKARYEKAHPHWSNQQVEEHAAEIVRNTYPTYSKIPEGVKAIRRFPLVGAFVSFPSEVIRTTFNSMSLGYQEMRSPETRAIGAQRVAGSIAALGGLTVLSRAMMDMFGISDEEDEDVRLFVAPWQENSQFIYTEKPKDATYSFVDLGYSDPHASLTDSMIAFSRGEDWQESLWGATAELLRPFASEDILAKALMDLRSNEGNKIYNPHDVVGEQAKDMVAHLWNKALEPGTISSLRRINTAIAGTDPRRDVQTEVTALLTGQRFQKVDIEHSLGFRIRDFAKSLTDIQNIARKTATSRGTATGEMVATDVARMERLRLAEFAEMQRIVGAARRLGVPEKNIRTMLEAQLADDVAEQIMTGDYAPYEMTPQTFQRMMEAQPEEFAERFAGWHGDKTSEATQRFVQARVRSLGAKLPDEGDAEYDAKSRKHEHKLTDTKAVLDIFEITHDKAQDLLRESYRKVVDGEAGSEWTSRGDLKVEYERAANAVASLYGEDFYEWHLAN